MALGKKLGRNDSCHCGSGKKYKRCCLQKDETEGKIYYVEYGTPDKLGWDLRKRVLTEISIMKDLFGIRLTASGLSVRKEISSDRIRELYKTLLTVWPLSTDVYKLLPKPDTSFKAFYWGSRNVDAVSNIMTRYCLYTDQILVIDPFIDRLLYSAEHSPLRKPEEWKQIAVNQALFLCSLEPWISEGIVQIVPPPQIFDRQLDETLINLAQTRMKKYTSEDMQPAVIDMTQDFLISLPPDALESYVFGPDFDPMPKKDRRSLIEGIRRTQKRDPIRYAWGIERGTGRYYKGGQGINLEGALLMANLTGCYLFTDREHLWNQLFQEIESSPQYRESEFTELSYAFQKLHFNFLNNVPLDFALDLRREGRLNSFRVFLREIWTEINRISSREVLTQKIKSFKDKLSAEYSLIEEEWRQIDQKLKAHMGKWSLGAGLAILTGHIRWDIALGALAAYGVKQLIESHFRRKALQTRPIAVFLNLALRGRGK